MISNDEKEHIVVHMTRLNMARDLAMMFITRKEFNTEDLFEYSYTATNKNFFKEVFNIVGQYIISRIGKVNSYDVMGDIFERIWIDEYIKKVDYTNKNSVLSGFVADMLKYLQGLGLHSEASYIVNTMLKCNCTENEVIKDILLSSGDIITIQMVESVVGTYEYEFADNMEFIFAKFETTGNYIIEELLAVLHANDDFYTNLLEYTIKKFDIYSNKKGSFIAPRQTGKRKRFAEFLREYLRNRLLAGMESDLYQMVYEAIERYDIEKNRFLGDMYRKFLGFLNSEERRVSVLDNLLGHGYEEPEELFIPDEIYFLANEKHLLKYIMDLDAVSNFTFLVRMANLGRFEIFNNRIIMPIVEQSLSKRYITNFDMYILNTVGEEVFYRFILEN